MWNLARIISSGRRFIAEVDGLRFIAIMAVFIFHLNAYTHLKAMNGAEIRPIESWVSEVFSVGHYGVQLFFVLSGFLLAIPFAKWRLGLGSQPSLKAYYLRRLTRLEPPYIISMGLLFVGGLIVVGISDGLSRWPNLLASLIYHHNLIYGEMSIINSVAWSLEIEVQFYLLAPFLAVVFSVQSALARRALMLLSIITLPCLRDLTVPFPDAHIAKSLPFFLEYFLAGFLLADHYLVDWREAPNRSWTWDLATLLGWPILLALMLSGRLQLLLPLAILLAYVGTFRGKASSWIFSRPQLTLIGGMCYSMYLLHYATISITGRFAKAFLFGTSFSTRFAVEALFAVPAVLIVTIIFFVLLERPCMDPAWPTKIVQRGHAWFKLVDAQG
jgi:peptidoglycan/LPS O-acetylase OafA/YrhL